MPTTNCKSVAWTIKKLNQSFFLTQLSPVIVLYWGNHTIKINSTNFLKKLSFYCIFICLYFLKKISLFILLEVNYFKYCGGFCHILTWICHRCTCVLHLDPPSPLPPHPIPQGSHIVLALHAQLHASNLDWSSISHMVIYMFQCYSLKSSHPCLLPQSPKICSLYLCLFYFLILFFYWIIVNLQYFRNTAEWLSHIYIYTHIYIWLHIHTYILFQILLHYRPPQDIEYSSLLYTVGPCH